MITKPIPERFKPEEFEAKWQKRWEEAGTYRPDIKNPKKPYYNLMMFPYPSAEGLHVGNMYAFTGVDVHGRFMRQLGFDVFEPIGLDGFGIHSENYALKVGRKPQEHAAISENNFYRQLRATGNGYDWTRTVETYDPDYYRWTQWLFVQMFKHGLAYRAKALVNWCPTCKTVLADEQVIDGKCERTGDIVIKKELEQWFFRITSYAEKLLQNTYKPSFKWPEKVKIGQRNWIGKKSGVIIHHKVKDLNIQIDTFSAYPGSLFADTFIVIAPEHSMVKELIKGTQHEKKVEEFVKEVKKMNSQDRIAEGMEKQGIFTGRYAIDPFGNGEMPIWIANFALLEFGTGIIRCSAHDPRDYQFASKYKISLKEVVDRTDPNKPVNAHSNKGLLKDSGPFSGKKVEESIEAILNWIEKEKIGKRHVTYRIRDWLISRQRYWGAPLPMVYCEKCAKAGKNYFDIEKEVKSREIENKMPGWFPVEEENLPVTLPNVEDWRPTGTGRGPLAGHPEFYNTTCPNCNSPAKRETDVADTFLDSAWYYLRYPNVGLPDVDLSRKGSKLLPWNLEIDKKWMPVDSYIGGAEHTVLHLLYTRFTYMALKDWGYLESKPINEADKFDPDEPFKRFYAHGLIIKDGAKMSKSKGNVVIPDDYIKLYGSDSLRTYLMFLGPFDAGGDFRDSGIAGMYKWLSRVWRLASNTAKTANKNIVKDSPDGLKLLHKTIKGVTEDLMQLRFNTSIAKLMIFTNWWMENLDLLSVDHVIDFLKLLAPFAPHMTEELYQQLIFRDAKEENKFESIHTQPWPIFDSELVVENQIIVVIQINGKVRDSLVMTIETSKNQVQVEQAVKVSAKAQKWLSDRKISKVIFVPGRLINYVIAS